MRAISPILFGLIIAVDMLLGLVLTFWPGLWHEFVHGWIVRTTFFIPQALGVLILVRAIHLMVMGRRLTCAHRTGHAYLWFGQAVLCLAVSVRLLGEPFQATGAYLLGAAGAVTIGTLLWPRDEK